MTLFAAHRGASLSFLLGRTGALSGGPLRCCAVNGMKGRVMPRAVSSDAPSGLLHIPEWEAAEVDPAAPPPAASLRLKVVTYNCLAQCYVKSSWFPYAPPSSLKWKGRSERLGRLLQSFDADVLCLQVTGPPLRARLLPVYAHASSLTRAS